MSEKPDNFWFCEVCEYLCISQFNQHLSKNHTIQHIQKDKRRYIRNRRKPYGCLMGTKNIPRWWEDKKNEKKSP